MVKHTQTIRRLLAMNCLSVFDHFVGLALKGLNDHCSNYSGLIQRSGSVSMENQRLHAIACKVFKTLIELNPNFMEEIFYRSPNLTHRKENLYVHSQNTIKF